MVRLSILLNFLQQWSGINAVIFYSTQIFSGLGGGVLMSRVYTIMMGFVNMVSVMTTIPLIDKAGRKFLIVFGCICMTVSMTALGIPATFTTMPIFYSVTLILLYVVSFEFSLGPVVWLYIGEIANEKAMSVGASTNGFMAASVVYAFLFMVEGFGI